MKQKSKIILFKPAVTTIYKISFSVICKSEVRVAHDGIKHTS